MVQVEEEGLLFFLVINDSAGIGLVDEGGHGIWDSILRRILPTSPGLSNHLFWCRSNCS
jgi:hypothetical protein